MIKVCYTVRVIDEHKNAVLARKESTLPVIPYPDECVVFSGTVGNFQLEVESIFCIDGEDTVNIYFREVDTEEMTTPTFSDFHSADFTFEEGQ